MKAFAAFNSTMNYDEKQKAFFYNLYFNLYCGGRGLLNCGYGDQLTSYMGGISADFYMYWDGHAYPRCLPGNMVSFCL